jgi:predicted nucleotidyltransferase component of viral defense system
VACLAPWSSDAQVEQDLILSRVLIEIFSNAMLASHLAFRGGTALHKLFLNPASRYSQDIDLVQLNSEPIGPILTALHQTLDPWLREPRRKQSEGRAALIYRFNSEIAPITPLRLKVEINTREHFVASVASSELTIAACRAVFDSALLPNRQHERSQPGH